MLDPPYMHAAGRAADCYIEDGPDVAAAVREWAVKYGENVGVRIALCGYEGEHTMPDSWECVAWSAGGMDRLGNARGSKNKDRERIWFSPHCLRPDKGQLALLEAS